jgi:hypothetical protein
MFGGGGHNSLFDHFRNGNNVNIMKSLIKKAYIVSPLLKRDKGIDPLFDNEDNIDKEYILCDENYQWLTLVELNQNVSITKSQGQLTI